jgi:hypothetical protein
MSSLGEHLIVQLMSNINTSWLTVIVLGLEWMNESKIHGKSLNLSRLLAVVIIYT